VQLISIHRLLIRRSTSARESAAQFFSLTRNGFDHDNRDRASLDSIRRRLLHGSETADVDFQLLHISADLTSQAIAFEDLKFQRTEKVPLTQVSEHGRNMNASTSAPENW
jgi:hypothetical protein